MKIYCYSKCGTCNKALKWLNQKNIQYTVIPIREQPPTKQEIKAMITKYGIKRLFNTSGGTYRELNIKEKLPKLSETEIINLLHSNGNLIKRPFVTKPLLIGFKQEEWENSFQ